METAMLCHHYGWSVEYAEGLEANIFDAMLNHAVRLHAVSQLDFIACVSAAVPLTEGMADAAQETVARFRGLLEFGAEPPQPEYTDDWDRLRARFDHG